MNPKTANLSELKQALSEVTTKINRVTKVIDNCPQHALGLVPVLEYREQLEEQQAEIAAELYRREGTLLNAIGNIARHSNVPYQKSCK